MANLANFIYCLNAERIPAADGQGESVNALGIVNALTPEYVPGAFSFSIVFSVLKLDVKKHNSIRVVFSSSEDSKVLVDTQEIMIPPAAEENSINLPEENKGFIMSMDMRNVVFETNGLYETEIIVNQETIGKVPIYVKGKR